MDEIIRSSRSPWVMVHEMTPIEGIPDNIASSSTYAPERILAEYQSFFGRFRSRKHEFAAVFGKNAAEPFDQMWSIRLDINHAVDGMLCHKELQKARDPDNRELWLSWYNVAFRNVDESTDPLIPRLQKAVASIEAICRPAMLRPSRRGSRRPWTTLKLSGRNLVQPRSAGQDAGERLSQPRQTAIQQQSRRLGSMSAARRRSGERCRLPRSAGYRAAGVLVCHSAFRNPPPPGVR